MVYVLIISIVFNMLAILTPSKKWPTAHAIFDALGSLFLYGGLIMWALTLA